MPAAAAPRATGVQLLAPVALLAYGATGPGMAFTTTRPVPADRSA